MKLFENALGGQFKDAPEGRVFYPYGARAGGVVVSSETGAAVRRFMGWWLLLLFVVTMPGAVVIVQLIDGPVAIVVALIPIALMQLAAIIGINRLTAGCPRAATKMTLAEIRERERPSWRIGAIVYLGLGVLVIGTAVTLFVFSGFGLGPTLFVGGCGILFIASALIGWFRYLRPSTGRGGNPPVSDSRSV